MTLTLEQKRERRWMCGYANRRIAMAGNALRGGPDRWGDMNDDQWQRVQEARRLLLSVEHELERERRRRRQA